MNCNTLKGYFNRQGHPTAIMSLIVLLFAYVSLTTASPTHQGGDCVISIKYKSGDLNEPQPLILSRTGNVASILYPKNGEDTLRIPAGQSIYLACPGKNNLLAKTNLPEAKATCVRDKIFSVDGVERSFSSLVCKFMPESHAKHIVGSVPCYNGYSNIEIGFNVSGQFLRQIELCRDDRTYTTYYTKFHLTKEIASYQQGYPRPKRWFGGNIYYPEINMEDAYRFESQVDNLAKILDSYTLANQYLKRTVQFLARGHMSAKADFVYGSQHTATFWYLNTAPQWQTFNGGNWNQIEYSVRKFASSHHLDLEVYTGSYGQMTMIDVHGKPQPISLHAKGSSVALHSPRFYWKVIYDPLSKKGTAFIGLNDPFVKSITKDIYLCPDISAKIDWLEWKKNNIEAGVSYACTVGDFRKAVPYLPAFKVVDVLV